MKGIILYGSFHGSTKESAERLSLLTNFEAISIEQADSIALSSYDKIVIGSAIQGFQFHPGVRQFLAKYQELLDNKQVFLFVHAIQPQMPTPLLQTLPEKLISKWEIWNLGGKIVWNSLTLSEKIPISLISFFSRKNIKNISTINLKKLEKLGKKIICEAAEKKK